MKNVLYAVMAGAALVLAAAGAWAQAYPTKPVRFIVPQAPGGASDALARIIGQKLSDRLGQQFIIENRAGAGGNVGSEIAAKAAPDGYTLLLGYVGTHAINVSLYKQINWHPVKDFSPVATIATLPFALVANPALPVSSVSELIAMARARPGQINFASAGNGSVNHLLGEMLKAAAGVEMVHVPYKGAAAALTDIIGGQVQIMFTSMPSVAGHVRAGTVKGLAVSSAQRAAAFPSIPTVAESGVPGFDVSPWFGIFTTAGAPKEVIGKLNAEVAQIVVLPDVKEKMAAQGADPFITTPEKFAAILAADIEKWAKVVQRSGARVD